MKHLYKKELGYYLNNPIGYIVIILFAVFANFLFIKDIFLSGSASMKPFFGILPWLYLVFIPALTMRAIAEEKKANTIEILLSLPVSETQIVVAKFFALMTLIMIGLGLTFGLPISLSFLTKMSLMEIIIGYIGEIFLGGVFVSLSLVMSSLTKNQVVAFLTSVIFAFFLLAVGAEFMAGIAPKSILIVLSYFSPVYHLESFTKGLLDLRSILYFISFSFVLLFMTIVNLEKRD